jgi:uncharacterized protein
VLAVLGTLCVGGYAALCGAVYKYQDRMIYFPDDYFSQDPAAYGLQFEEFELEVQPGNTVTGWIVESEKEAPWVLHFHGNAGNISHRVDHLRLFRELGFNSVVFDYRGYGKSQGIPSEAGLVADGLAMVKYLTEERGVHPKMLIYFGESLGGAVASAVAVTKPPRAMILKSTFTSVPDLASEVYPFLPVRWLAKTQFATKDRVSTFLFPKLIIHGSSDTLVPFEHGQRLFQLCSEPKEFLEVHREHNTSPLELGEEFKTVVQDFVKRAVPQDW